MLVQMCDPAEGWKYGFPKPIPYDVKEVVPWLIEQGYPKEEIDKYGEHFYCRFWLTEVEDDVRAE